MVLPYTHTSKHIYIYIYIRKKREREGEREREREREGEREGCEKKITFKGCSTIDTIANNVGFHL